MAHGRRLWLFGVTWAAGMAGAWGAAAETPAAPAQVTLPLERYEALLRAQERASVTVVDTLRVRGSFEGRDLRIELAGRSAGRLPAEGVLEAGADVVLHGCEGDGIVSRGEDGAFRLTPLGPRFDVRCRLSTRGSDRLELVALPAVLWVEAAVSDGEYVPGADAQGRRPFTVVRRAADTAERLTPSAAGRYRITLLPDETRFRYQVEVRNPNRGRQRFTLRLSGDEHVQQVDAAVPYDAEGGRYTFDLPPGDSTLALGGRLAGTAFTPPVAASLHYVLVESHPLLRAEVAGAPRRVGPDEVGLAASFRGAQAFLLSGAGARLEWKVTRLEALRTTSYAVRQARHTFFVAADGPALGESFFGLDNRGASDLRLPSAAEPTFASLQGEPLLLTKDGAGRLWLPLAQGEQQLVVQHRQAFARGFGFATATLHVPQLPVPATRTHVELRYPGDWTPLVESFATSTRVWRPGGDVLLLFVLVALWAERVLRLLGLAAGARRLLAVVAALAALAWWLAALVAVAALGAVSAVWLLQHLRRREWPFGRVLAAAGLLAVGGFFTLMLVSALLSTRERVTPEAPATYEAPLPQAPAPGRANRAVGTPSEEVVREGFADPATHAAEYQGLPAKFELPGGATRTFFHRELLSGDEPRTAQVWLVSAVLLAWLRGVLVLLSILLVWRARAALVAGWRARLDALRAAAPGRAEAAS